MVECLPRVHNVPSTSPALSKANLGYIKLGEVGGEQRERREAVNMHADNIGILDFITG